MFSAWYWLIPVALRIGTAHIAVPVLLKHVTSMPSRLQRFALQFWFSLIFASTLWVIALVIKRSGVFNGIPWFQEAMDPALPLVLWFIVGFGVINAFAAYAQWRAVDISVSKNALFGQADDFIALMLGYTILNEMAVLTPSLVFGVSLCMVAAPVFTFVSNKYGAKTSDPQVLGIRFPRFLLWVGMYTIVWGFAEVLMRGYASTSVPLPGFMVAWYAGSFFGAILMLLLFGKKEKPHDISPRNLSGFKAVALLGFLIFISNALAYSALWMAELTKVIPIFQITEIVFPLLIGLWVFKEHKKLYWQEWAVLAVGAAGVVIVVIASHFPIF